MTFSKSEILFWKSKIKKHQRLDRRKLDERRQINFEILEIPQCDFALKVKSGEGEMDIFLRFFESDEVFSKLEIENQTNKKETIFKNINFIFLKDEINRQLKDFGVSIETDVHRDDGNVFIMFYSGLNYIFKDIEMPIIEEEGDIGGQNISIDLPLPVTIGIFEGIKIADPNLVESDVCSDILNILRHKDDVEVILLDKSGGMTVDEIVEAVFGN